MGTIFGLPRKKSAGVSFRPPLHRDLFFHQDEVDQFVGMWNEEIWCSKGCKFVVLTFPVFHIVRNTIGMQ